jgi:DNA gyrase subunit A
MIINKSGLTIRMGVAELRVMGRATQGVRLINLRNGDEIAAVAKVEVSEDVEDLVEPTEGEDGDEDQTPPAATDNGVEE